jgi:hypothetical protein
MIYLTMFFSRDLHKHGFTTLLIHNSGARVDPNNYWIIMVGHPFSKLHGTTLNLNLFEEIERIHLNSKGHERLIS